METLGILHCHFGQKWLFKNPQLFDKFLRKIADCRVFKNEMIQDILQDLPLRILHAEIISV